jgi:hypothetical protein
VSVGAVVCYEGDGTVEEVAMTEVVDGSLTGRACAVVRRYVTDALFGADELALRETVADEALAERAWMFWAAFNERDLQGIDVIFADAEGGRVACHFTGSLVQVGPWVTPLTPVADGGTMAAECTAIYTITADRIVNFHETWR